MRPITIDQSHQVMATLAVNTNWGEIDFEEAGLQKFVIRNAKEAGRQFTAFLKNGARMMAQKTFSVFKTIKLGTGLKTADEFHKALGARGMIVDSWANDILSKPAFTVTGEETEVDLVVLATAQLTGNKAGGTTSEVFTGAQRLELEKCPAEVGPQLRWQYGDQPMGERLLIAMESITSSGGYPRVFDVGHGDDGLWLGGSYCGDSGSFWDADDQWVFVRPRKKS